MTKPVLAVLALAVLLASVCPAVHAQDDAKRQQALDALDQALGKPSGGAKTASPPPASPAGQDGQGVSQEAMEYQEKGKAANQAGDMDQAIAHFSKVIELAPDFYRGYSGRGTAWFFKGDYERAAADLNASIKLKPNELSFHMLGDISSERKDRDMAINYYTRSIELKPDALVLVKRAAMWVDKGDFDKALKDLDDAIKLEPDFGLAYWSRALVWKEKGDLAKGKADAAKAKQLDPSMDEPSWAKAATPGPGVADDGGKMGQDYFASGRAAFEAKNYDQAIADFTKVIEIDPDFYGGYGERGACWFFKGDLGKAEADLNASIKVKPNASAYYFLAKAALKKNDLDRATDHYSRAIDLFPDFASAFLERGVVFAKRGSTDRAIKDYTQAIKLRPDMAMAYLARALAWQDKGDKAKARADAAKAKQLDPSLNVPSF